jgi:hypothetical protein
VQIGDDERAHGGARYPPRSAPPGGTGERDGP